MYSKTENEIQNDISVLQNIDNSSSTEKPNINIKNIIFYISVGIVILIIIIIFYKFITKKPKIEEVSDMLDPINVISPNFRNNYVVNSEKYINVLPY